MAHFLGIDGGASKARGALIAASGRVLARASAGGSSIIGLPHAEALATLAGIAQLLCAKAGVPLAAVAGCGLGLNGVDFADEIPGQHAALAAGLGVAPERLVLVNDGIAALWGASPAPAAAILQHGSAFTGGYRARHGAEALFDHLGVGETFDLRGGLRVLVARMLDGRAEPTPLLDAALAHYGVTADDYAEALFRQRIPWARLNSTAPLIFAAWQADDPAAGWLVERALDEYALVAAALIARTGSDAAEIAFGGGVIQQAPPRCWALLAGRVRARFPRVTVKSPDLPPEHGAAIMAACAAGVEPVSLFQSLRRDEKEHPCETVSPSPSSAPAVPTRRS
ncbi:MAG TPA: BadF/BadG/BcrA/BcrD ATPase family protein [Armatimonadota bacterium]|nr:BadF/BadG/BcrA/BcrD ATPase family protein [Armatimonadota bacterium]